MPAILHYSSHANSKITKENQLSCFLVVTLQAFRKLDTIATGQAEKLRKLTKKVQEQRKAHDDAAVKSTVEEYDETLEWWANLSYSDWYVYFGVNHLASPPPCM